MPLLLATLLPLLLFPPAFIGMWAFVCWIIAQAGGWSRLAQSYLSQSEFTGRKWTLQFGRMGLSRYRGVLTVGANREGVFLDVMPLFRVGHPPLFIPWHDITIGEDTEWMMLSYVVFTFAKSPGVKLRLLRGLGDEVMAERPEA